MCIDMVDRLIGKYAPDSGIRFARLCNRRIDHHAVCIESAQRQDAPIQCRWNFIFISGRSRSSFADENRMAGPIRVLSIMRDMIDEQQRFACLGINELNAARKARLAIGNHSDGAMICQFSIAEDEKMGELRGLEAGNAVGHALALRWARFRCFLPLAPKLISRELVPQHLGN